MKQRAGRPAGHPRGTIRRTGAVAFEQTEDRTHPAGGADSGNHMHFRSPWIGETDFYPVVDQGLEHALGAIHDGLSSRWIRKLIQIRLLCRRKLAGPVAAGAH
jgi:hypothetical protein